jgi:hypothetical protein
VENQSGRRIRVLRLDNGGEYTSNEFMEYCDADGIKKELTVPYTTTHWKNCDDLIATL